MIIVSQGGDIILPYNGIRLKANNKGAAEIVAYTLSGQGKVMAIYGEYSRAQAIMKEFANNLTTKERNVYIFLKE